MRIVEALALGAHEVVAFVGAGGKTTAMFRLADELRAASRAVVVTTTTKIYAPRETGGLRLVAGTDRVSVIASTAAVLAAHDVPVVGRGVTSEGKLEGVPPEWIEALASLPDRPTVLVEADGARALPITAPRSHEPVIPSSSTLVVGVVGVDAIEAPISAVGHHPELIAALTGLDPDDTLDASAVARVLLGPQGNTKGRPKGARIVALVNKADTPERIVAARGVAAELLRAGAERAIVMALRSDTPVVEVLAR